jgi:hypothetical protein
MGGLAEQHLCDFNAQDTLFYVLVTLYTELILPAILWPWVNQPLIEMSARNVSWGVKAAGAYGGQAYLHVPIIWKYGSFIVLETYGPLQACIWIALFLRINTWWSFYVVCSREEIACLHLNVRATERNGIEISKYLFVFRDLRSVPSNVATGDKYDGWSITIFLSHAMFSKVLLFYTDYLCVSKTHCPCLAVQSDQYESDLITICKVYLHFCSICLTAGQLSVSPYQ